MLVCPYILLFLINLTNSDLSPKVFKFKPSLVKMKRMAEVYVNNSITHEEFFNECLFGARDATLLLGSFKRYVTCFDDGMTTEEAKNLADHRAFVMQVFRRLKVEGDEMPDPGQYLTDFSAIYKNTGQKILDADLTVYKKSFKTYQEAISDFLREVREREAIEVDNFVPRCFMRQHIYSSNFNYSKVEEYKVEIRAYLDDITSIAKTCDMAMSRRKPDYVFVEIAEASESIEKWFDNSLESAWPSAYHQILNEQIVRYNSTFEDGLKKAADMAHLMFNTTGAPNYTYQILIVKAGKKEHDIDLNGMSKYCSVNEGPFGFDTIICRRPVKTEIEKTEFRSETSRKRELVKKLKAAILNEMDKIYYTPYLSKIAETLKKTTKLGSITAEDFLGCAIGMITIMILHPILLLILFSQPASATYQNVKIVDDAVNAMAEITTESPHIHLSLSSFQESKVANFLNSMVPMIRLVKEGINQVINEHLNQNETEMYKMLSDFKTRTDPMWRRIDKMRDRSPDFFFYMDSGYYDKIADPVEYINVKTVIDPEQKIFNDTIPWLKKECMRDRYKDSKKTLAENMLEYLEQQFVTECEPITAKEAKNLADQRLYLLNIVKQLKNWQFRFEDLEFDIPIGSRLDEFASFYQLIDNKKLDSNSLVFSEKPFDNWGDFFTAFFDELREKGGLNNTYSGSRCLPRKLLLEYNFNHEHTTSFNPYVSSHLTYLIYYAGICSGALYEGKEIEQYNKNIATRVAKIAAHTNKYLDESLASSWPAIHNGILKEYIFRLTSKQGNLSEQIEEVLTNTRDTLMKTGTPNYSYDILIVKPETKKYDIYYDGMENSCSHGERAFGLDTIISRKPILNLTEIESINEQVKRSVHSKKLDAIIQREMRTISDDNLPAIAHHLKEKFKKEMSTTDAFKCWAIVRERKTGLIHGCPDVQSWLSPNNSIFNTSYKNNAHVIKACQEFQFYFFM